MAKRPCPEGPPLGQKDAKLQHNTVPEITVGGITYRSDRYYLNSGPNNSSPTNDDFPSQVCQCGAETCSPPPLFDRDKLLREKIDNDELEAVIISTFNVCLEWLPERYPELMGPNSTIPTLFLYGRKATMDYSNSLSGTSSSLLEEEDSNTNDSWEVQPRKREESPAPNFGKNFHLTKVLPTSDNSIKGVTQEKKDAKEERKWSAGVYHPKFLLLFEKSGHLTVVVSTANFVPSATLEGSWIQRFERRKQPTNGISANDFGTSLGDFLIHLGKASEKGAMRVDKFLKQYMDIKLGELFRLYIFEQAKVHLIPIIPGQFQTNSRNAQKDRNAKKDGNAEQDPSADKWGRHRVKRILKKLEEQRQKVPTTPNDRLVVQPTSIGKDMTIGQLAHICKSYLGCSREENNLDVLDRATIVWPSWEYLANFTEKVTTATKPPRKRLSGGKRSNVIYEKGTQEDFDCYVFFSAAAFNSMHQQCMYRMAQFHNSHPCQFPTRFLTPHFKSITRVCNNPKVCKEYKRKETLSWFLLTSACLSAGAQGKVINEGKENECISYANFELGVLFTSERPEFPTGRLYCFAPKCCTFNGRNASNLIHLPVPYSLDPEFYLNENDPTMSAMPYFHEIRETDKVGNFLCTPHRECEFFNRARDSENKENNT